jgi:hypothetical protein
MLDKGLTWGAQLDGHESSLQSRLDLHRFFWKDMGPETKGSALVVHMMARPIMTYASSVVTKGKYQDKKNQTEQAGQSRNIRHHENSL